MVTVSDAALEAELAGLLRSRPAAAEAESEAGVLASASDGDEEEEEEDARALGPAPRGDTARDAAMLKKLGLDFGDSSGEDADEGPHDAAALAELHRLEAGAARKQSVALGGVASARAFLTIP